MNTTNNTNISGGPHHYHHHQQIPGNAPTASPELSILTPTNTGSGQSTTKREPYLRNWFMSSTSSSPSPAVTAPSATTVIVQQHSHPAASSTGGTNSPANASLAASSHALSAMSVGSDNSFPPMQSTVLDLASNSTPNHSPIYGSSANATAIANSAPAQHSGSKYYYKR